MICAGTVGGNDWAQHFFQIAKEMTAMIRATLIMAAGKDKCQCSAENGFCCESNFWRR